MLKKQIGIDAGVVWRLLDERGRLSLRKLGELLGINSTRIILAIGWLARENKIVFIKENEMEFIELTSIDSHLYY